MKQTILWLSVLAFSCSSSARVERVFVERDAADGELDALAPDGAADARPPEGGMLDSGSRVGPVPPEICPEVGRCGDLGEGEPATGCPNECRALGWRTSVTVAACSNWAGDARHWCGFSCAAAWEAAELCYSLGARCCFGSTCLDEPLEPEGHSGPSAYGSLFCCPRARCP